MNIHPQSIKVIDVIDGFKDGGETGGSWRITAFSTKIDVEARPCLAQDEGRDVYSVPRSAYEGDLSKSRLLKTLKRAV